MCVQTLNEHISLIVASECRVTTQYKGPLQRLFPSISSGYTIAVIGSAAKFNSDFVKNRSKIFTAVLMEKPL
jgi:hypothetical protein